jgi:hypothetical protein
MQHFEITLKNEKTKQYEKIALFIIIINFALFVYCAISTNTKPVRIAAISGGVIILIALAIDYFLTYIKNNEHSPYKHFALYAISMAWLKIGYWWIGLVCILIGSLYFMAKRLLLINVHKEKIIYPSFPKKNIAWSQLNNMILKDGLLTIDFKNNKFMQQAVDESKTAVNEQEFNDFCRQQLNK